MNTFLGIEHFGGRVVYIIWTYKIFSWLNTIVSLKSKCHWPEAQTILDGHILLRDHLFSNLAKCLRFQKTFYIWLNVTKQPKIFLWSQKFPSVTEMKRFLQSMPAEFESSGHRRPRTVSPAPSIDLKKTREIMPGHQLFHSRRLVEG